MSNGAGAAREQWPHDPLAFATRLHSTPEWGSCIEVLRRFDQGLAARTFKFGHCAVPKNNILAHQLTTLGIVYVFADWVAPLRVFRDLGEEPDDGLGVVTSFVKRELDLHFALPRCLGQISRCLRPDIVNMALKVWKHGSCVPGLERLVKDIANTQWVFHPYCIVGAKIVQTLNWVGAAMVLTGRKRDADIAIGQTFIIVVEKDRLATVLVLLLCCQTDSNFRALIESGPATFRPLLALQEIF